MNIKRFRKEFPVTKKYTFLDHACIGPLSQRAAEYMRAFVEDMHRHGGIHEDRWVEEKFGKGLRGPFPPQADSE